MTVPTWDRTKHLLGEFDGTATEIFLVGLPISQLCVVMKTLSCLPALEVISFENEALENSEPFDAGWRSRFESIPSFNCQRSLRSSNGTARHLQVYLWADTNTNLLELELVFWNDMTFTRGLEIEEYEKRLRSLCSIVEECRVGIPSSRCVLSPEHNGPTEDLSKVNYVVWW